MSGSMITSRDIKFDPISSQAQLIRMSYLDKSIQLPKLKIMAATFNLGNSRIDNLQQLLPPNFSNNLDIIAFGFQESIYKTQPNSQNSQNDSNCLFNDRNSQIGKKSNKITDKLLDTLNSGTLMSPMEKMLSMECRSQLGKDILNILGDSFKVVQHCINAQMQLLVFIRDEHAEYVDSIEVKQENTGFLSILPNKGGLRISFNVYGTYLTFISCHLAAHEGYKKCHVRNESTVEILGGLRVGDKKDFDISSISHHTIWMGDMNYRVTFDQKTPADIDNKSKQEIINEEVPSTATANVVVSVHSDDAVNDSRDEEGYDDEEDDGFQMDGKLSPLLLKVDVTEHSKILNLIANRQYKAILELDELNREVKAGRALSDFKPLIPNFPPTFKRIRHTSITTDADAREMLGNPLNYYNKKRIPSYTDRVLYKSLPGFTKNLTNTGFDSVETITSSDHKPVRAFFDLTVVPGVAGINLSKHNTTISNASGGLLHFRLSHMQGFDLDEMDSQLFGGKSDPYISIHTDPTQILDKPASRLTSSVIKHNINPIWPKKEVMDIKIQSTDLNGLKENCHLFISIWDEDLMKTNDLIGVLSMSFDEIITFYESPIKNHERDFLHIEKRPIYNNGRITGHFSGELRLMGKLPKFDPNKSGQLYYNEKNNSDGCGCGIQ